MGEAGGMGLQWGGVCQGGRGGVAVLVKGWREWGGVPCGPAGTCANGARCREADGRGGEGERGEMVVERMVRAKASE